VKPKRFFFRSPPLFGAALRYGTPVCLGFSVLISNPAADAREMFGPGMARSATTATATTGGATPATTDLARANAQTMLARTNQTLVAMRAMQTAARNAALLGANHLGTPAAHLPDVPNGLTSGGLQVATLVADPLNPGKFTNWKGANQPVQSVSGSATTVTVKQTAQQALLNWQTFNVGKQTTVTFDQSAGGQNASQWIAFNKISDPTGNPTQILGSIKAAGQVYLINQNGVIFGGSSQVNTRNLTVSALPINDNLVQQGLLNNPDREFLFDGISKGKIGDIVVEAGSQIFSPVNDDGNGGRVVLAGANVTNSGTIATPNGQTILAAGLQVGMVAHSSDDPSIRGLDVYVGAVVDPATSPTQTAGTATNIGLIEAAQGNITLTGKEVNQHGIAESLTSVSLNGSVNLLANYGAVKNATYDPANATTGAPFNFNAAGTVTLGEGSITRILPDYQSSDRTAGSELALRSQITAQGSNIHMASGAVVFAPSAKVSFHAGSWTTPTSGPSSFLSSSGQIYLDDNAVINLAGTPDAAASVLQNFLTVTLRGSELSVAPLQRNGVLRGDTIVVDITKTGTFNGQDWVGTPLADVSGYLGLIERDVSQLTTGGGTLDLAAGGSVVIRHGATIDVSGGWTNFAGAAAQTTRLWSHGRLVDIANATPDQTYSGIFTGTSTFTNSRWGVTQSYQLTLSPGGKSYQAGYTRGADAGAISISTPAAALDGTLLGLSVAGEHQVRSATTASQLPAAASLTLKIQAQLLAGSTVYTYSPPTPLVTFGSANQARAADFTLNANGEAPVLAADRIGNIFLSPTLVSTRGFGNLTVVNEGGDILLPENITLNARTGSQLSLTAANIHVLGNIVSPGGALSFTALNQTSYQKDLLTDDSATPAPNPGRGVFTLGAAAVLSTAGAITDDQAAPGTSLAPVTLNGGSVNIAAYTANLQAGGLIDVSGGYLLTKSAAATFGNGGTITIEAGKDPGKHTVLGGSLTLDATTRGFSGKTGGTLNLLAPRFQLGGASGEAGSVVLQPEFFNQGGFGNIKLTGLGVGASPGILVSEGTKIQPVVKRWLALPTATGVSLGVIQDIVSTRTPMTLTLASPGVKDLTTVEVGDIVLDINSKIITDPGGNVRLTGGTVSILGSIIAPGGSISAGGGSTNVFGMGLPTARVTTYLGPNSLLSAAGTTVFAPDPYGLRSGKVWAGGTITIGGNVAVASGAVFNVSGTSATMDIDAAAAGPGGTSSGYAGGFNSTSGRQATVPVRVDSNAGNIILKGNELLFFDGTLIANAGGSTALGGSLTVASGVYDPTGNGLPASTFNLTVTQAGAGVSGGIGYEPGNGGHFAANAFVAGGFDSLALDGVIAFDGAVDLTARRKLSVASGGILYANAAVGLSAPHVTLGKSQPVVLPANEGSPFSGSVLPSYGSGTLTVNSGLIDLGHLSLQQIGSASLTAANGDIRGSGTVQIAGDLTLQAGQIYPNTASRLSFIAYDHLAGGVSAPGSITVGSSGRRALPLSAGGTLSLYASNITQLGTLRAPNGTILLGWDGTGTKPVDLLAGIAGGSGFPVTQNLTLGAGSVTAVSAIDPITGKAVTIPYGVSTDGENWIDPRGVDITTSGPPEKSIVLEGASVTTVSGSSVDLRGGGDLYAYRWVKGLGGPADILASTTSFAILPSYASAYAPVSEYNTLNSAENLISGNSGSGYTNTSLKTGDQIYLSGSRTLAAGYYTLLPARYALLPGAVLVSPKSGVSSGTVEMADSSSLVSGYRFNSLNSERVVPTLSSRFEVASSVVVRSRAQYENYLANTFLKSAGQNAGTTAARLPLDSGHLVIESTRAMDLLGSVASSSIAGGRGAAIDISTPLNTIISSGTHASAPGTIYLDSNTLTSFAAETLLIGGRRTSGQSGSNVAVSSNNVTVDNSGAVLSAQDLILAAKDSLKVAGGSTLVSTGSLANADNLLLSGDGALLRVSADPQAGILRSGSTGASGSQLTIDPGATLRGGAILMDSTAGISLAPTANLVASTYQFNAGNISLMLGDTGLAAPGGGLVVSNNTLRTLQGASALKLLSYASIDLFGSGSFGSASSLGTLTLSAGQIRGVNTAAGSVQIAAKNLNLENSSGAASSVATGATLGNLTISAETITLGSNNLAINGYSDVVLDASRGIIGQGSGGLAIQGDLSAQAPVLAGTAGSIRTIAAGGVLSLNGAGTGISSPIMSGMGASLAVTGASLGINTAIVLPSGSLTLRATSGDLTVGGLLDVSGTIQKFQDVTRVSGAGSINLAASAGNIVLQTGSKLDLSAPAQGGNGGALTVATPNGSLSLNGTILGSGGSGGTNGSLSLDILALPTLHSLSTILTGAGLTGNQALRVRSGNVIIDGTATARNFALAADQGTITVTGTIAASGATGGTIHLAARGDLTVSPGSLLTVAGVDFNSAGQGGSITLESGTQLNGSAGTGMLDIQTGSTLDLSVASKIAGPASTAGSSAYNGQFSGQLHLRAPRTAGNADLQVGAINGSIVGASSILVEGYKLYDLTSSGGAITSTVQGTIKTDATNYLGAAGATTANYTTISNRLLANNPGLADSLVLAPGVEIINRTGDLTLGTTTSTTTSDWNLAAYRFGAKSAAGVLTIRAAGNLTLFNALSDGFSPTLASSDSTWLWTARPTAQNTLLPVNEQTWSYRLVAGADLGAADFGNVLGADQLAAGVGSLKLGKTGTNISTGSGGAATTASAIANRYQVIRTGSGDIEIHAARSVQLLNQFATIYTAGTRVSDPTMGGIFRVPSLSLNGMDAALGSAQQSSAAFFTMGGGNVSIQAGENIEHLTLTNSQLVADSQFQMPTNWLYRRGYVDAATGEFGINRWGEPASTAWWVDFSNFFQGVGALGGGNVTLNAGHDISNVDAVIPTNARMPGYTSSAQTTVARPDATKLLELGGGDLTVRAGRNIDAGVYYVEKGAGTLDAGGSIVTNATRSVLAQSNISAGQETSYTELPTTLFVGKGGFTVDARGDVLLGPVANPFLLPGGLLNSFWQKTYFSTYSGKSYLDVTSLGGNVTLRSAATPPGQTTGAATPLLQSWFTNKLLLSSLSASNNKPWLRLDETATAPFQSLFSLRPGTLTTTSFSGDINVVGNITLSPSAQGTLELLAGDSIHGFLPNGVVTLSGVKTTTWGSSTLNLADADPAAIPGIDSPFAYQKIAGTSGSASLTGGLEFLDFINRQLAESGGTLGGAAVLQTRQALHAAGLLHLNDANPARLYAGGGDITGLTLFSAKQTRVLASRDIADLALYIQNNRPGDISVVASGRDLTPYQAASLPRIAAQQPGNGVNQDSGPQAGDIQISGPGSLQVLAGHTLDLGTGSALADGTGTGITSIGNNRNPYLPFAGAEVLVSAGLGLSSGLANSSLNLAAFITSYVLTPDGARLLDEIAPGVAFSDQSPAEQARLAIEVFYRVLRDAGRAHAATGSYQTADAAIALLFGSQAHSGSIHARARNIRTTNGGGISILIPGGGLDLANTTVGNALSPPGIITEGGGNISIFANNDISIGIGRIFTLRGGNEIIWSSHGNIAAGSSSKTVKSASPTRVLIDPQSAAVKTDLSGLATGGGIGVLATVKGVAPGNVDLIAPLGTVDAGDAGIRVSGNLNIAANQVLNTANIAVGGSSAGTPAPVSVSANIGGLTSAATTATASTNAASQAASNPSSRDNPATTADPPSIITVEVIGYGGQADKEDEQKE
jgi:filamentous hemagglutinin family protein